MANSKRCNICFYSIYEDKEYYLIELDNKVATKVLGKGYIWGKKKDALIFTSINVAKSYLKDIRNNGRTDAYIKEI